MTDIQQEVREAVELLSTLLDEEPSWSLASILNTLIHAGEELERLRARVEELEGRALVDDRGTYNQWFVQVARRAHPASEGGEV